MAKKNGNGSLGRKVKMSQPVAITFSDYVTLVEGKVVKGPTAPKMEVMEKWIVSGGRDIAVSRDHESGQYVAILTAKGADGPIEYEGEGETMALSVTEAIVGYLKAQPKPDPEGKDLPLFRGNGGVASVAEMQLEDEPLSGFGQADEHFGEQIEGVFVDDGAEPIGPGGFDTGDMPPANEWRFLFVVDPKDVALWKANAPWCDGAAIVDWEEGDEANDRGWYLDPGYSYDPKSGEIRVAGAELVVWSRDAVPAGV